MDFNRGNGGGGTTASIACGISSGMAPIVNGSFGRGSAPAGGAGSVATINTTTATDNHVASLKRPRCFNSCHVP
ncbi:hypothetical protein GCM10022231_19180 [Gordonia caeni]|uniref:Uncharacterized protein n=1 Tax=Gordonia caeni TaxID=1007097 RepID=A0ABP7P4I1_9ACTN